MMCSVSEGAGGRQMDTAHWSLLAPLGCMCSRVLYEGTRAGSARAHRSPVARSALGDQVGALGQHRGSGVKEAQAPPPRVRQQGVQRCT